MEFESFSAKNVSDAITDACTRFGVPSDQLEYEVVEEGSSGFLGFASKNAVIKARVKGEESETKTAVSAPAEKKEDTAPAAEAKKEEVKEEAKTEAPKEEKTEAKVAAPAEKTSESEVSGDGTYTVKAGDTYYSLGKKFGVSGDKLKELNNGQELKTGQVIKVRDDQ